MRANNITIDIIDKGNDKWEGTVEDFGNRILNVVGFFKVASADKLQFEGQDPRSIALVTKAPKGEKGERLGYLNFKVTAKGHTVIHSRSIKIPGTSLHFPVSGFYNVDEISGKGMVRLAFDNYYVTNQKQYWENKYDYNFTDSTSINTTIEDEMPF